MAFTKENPTRMKRECTVCMKEKLNGWMANTCDSHEPLVCKACMKEWLKQCETCPICRAVVHARTVMTGTKRARSDSDAAEQELEAQFAAERARAKENEKRAQEEADAEFARQLVEAEARREAREARMQARLMQRLVARTGMNMDSFLAALIRSGGEMTIVVDE